MAFINGIGLISPQPTMVSRDFLPEYHEYTVDYLKSIEPVYKNYINPIQLRRMSRLIKMGITSAKLSLADAGCDMPDAIITGTGLGSVEDTEKILCDISTEEKFLNPTPFIQSTYNTISSQVAIHLKCHNYNTTYVHRTFSFESGLIDGMMQLDEKSASDVLIGGIDEMTLNHLNITRRIALWKMAPFHNLSLLTSPSPGALAGEGAAFYLLSDKKNEGTYAELLNVKTVIDIKGSYSPEAALNDTLGARGLHTDDIDLVISGLSGDSNFDFVYHDFARRFFFTKALAWYKHLCGEYHTSTGFALYLAAQILKNQRYPEIMHANSIIPSGIRNILIYNQFRNVNHSFILLRAV